MDLELIAQVLFRTLVRSRGIEGVIWESVHPGLAWFATASYMGPPALRFENSYCMYQELRKASQL
jgi:hypothetical protein